MVPEPRPAHVKACVGPQAFISAQRGCCLYTGLRGAVFCTLSPLPRPGCCFPRGSHSLLSVPGTAGGMAGRRRPGPSVLPRNHSHC